MGILYDILAVIILWIVIQIILYWISFPIFVYMHLSNIKKHLRETQKTEQQMLEELVRIRKACEEQNKRN